MAHKGLPNKKIRCVRTTMMARSTSSHVRPDRLARTKMTIPFEFPCTHGRSIDAVHNHSQSTGERHDRLLHAAAPGDLHRPRLEPAPFLRTQHALSRFVEHDPHHLISAA